MQYLDFEQTLMEIDSKMEALRLSESQRGIDIATELSRLTQKREKAMREIYRNLSPWQKVCIARHEGRPHTSDYIQTLFTDFCELAGDRSFADDKAIIGGLAHFKGKTVMVMGHEKGSSTETRLKHNFGMPRPEGYRKAVRLMKLAEQYEIPVITFIDTPGAYPGVDAEERGEAEAIAKSIQTALNLKVSTIACVIGEGGSGGALALGVANRILMLENAIYSVISPEGCASILWKDFKFAPKVAEILHLTAADLLKLGLIDEIIDEPVGGAHRFPKETITSVQKAIEKQLKSLQDKSTDQLIQDRQDKFLAMTRKKYD